MAAAADDDHLAGRQQLVRGVPASTGEAELGLDPVAAGARREVADSSVAVIEAASLDELPVGEEGSGGAPSVSEDGEGADGAVSGVELDGVGRAVGGEGLVVGVAATAAGGEGDVGGAVVGAVEGDDLVVGQQCHVHCRYSYALLHQLPFSLMSLSTLREDKQ